MISSSSPPIQFDRCPAPPLISSAPGERERASVSSPPRIKHIVAPPPPDSSSGTACPPKLVFAFGEFPIRTLVAFIPSGCFQRLYSSVWKSVCPNVVSACGEPSVVSRIHQVKMRKLRLASSSNCIATVAPIDVASTPSPNRNTRLQPTSSPPSK